MIIIDDFIKDEVFLKQIRDISNWETPMEYRWYDKNNKNWDIFYTLSKQIWNFYFDIYGEVEHAGYECWTQIVEKGIEWHVDKDEHMAMNGQLVTPIMGSIYYAHEEPIINGFLETRNGNGLQRIEPVPNRLVIHDASNIHRVLPSTGIRKSFMTNMWEKKPSELNFRHYT